MKDITVTAIQADLVWENQAANLQQFETYFSQMTADTDVVVLPEMFTTGFSMNAQALAERMDGPTVNWMKSNAAKYQAALTGSIIIEDDNKYYNRLLWVNPDGTIHYYDKKHLFAMGGEHNAYQAGTEKLIVNYKGWRFCPLICYDLRFPVWSRYQKDYDALIYMASWPSKRSIHWRKLLEARAIENQAYVIGVNRVGEDGNGFHYKGDSMIVTPMGDRIIHMANHAALHTCQLSKTVLDNTRVKLPFLKDAASFEIG